VPCFFDEVTPVTQALADYYEKASTGDVLKSHDQFAVFSHNKRWEGDLTALRPGGGYMLRRNGIGTVTVHFANVLSNAPKRVQSANVQSTTATFSNPHASSNMTMIATVDNGQWTMDNGQLKVYVGDELAAVASPIAISTGEGQEEALYFLTIQSDRVGDLRFELNGETVVPVGGTINYSADSHHGSLKAPIVLRQAEGDRPYKIIEDNHVIIIRNGERYDVTGKKL
jgi:hypothetical protein